MVIAGITCLVLGVLGILWLWANPEPECRRYYQRRIRAAIENWELYDDGEWELHSLLYEYRSL